MSTTSKKAPFGTTFGSFFAHFLEAPKKTPKNGHKRSSTKKSGPKVPKRCQNGSPKGYQNPSKIIKKSSLSRRGLPQATCDLPEGPPPKRAENPPIFARIPVDFLAEYSYSLCLQNSKKTNGGRSVLYLLLWGERLRRQSTGYSLSLQNSPPKNGERSLLYFLLWGERLRRQSTGFVMTPCLTPRKKKSAPCVVHLGWCTALASRPFLPRRNERS